jgi:hypothetical protein
MIYRLENLINAPSWKILNAIYGTRGILIINLDI